MMTRAAMPMMLGLLVLAVGCSQPATLDHDATERAVAKAVSARIEPKVRSTSCPEDIRQREGEVTRCTVTLAGDLGRIRVLARQVDGDGRVTVTLQDAVLVSTKVASDLKAELARSFDRTFTATCGKGFRVVAPGTTFHCEADDGNGKRQITVTVKDPAGTVTYDVAT